MYPFSQLGIPVLLLTVVVAVPVRTLPRPPPRLRPWLDSHLASLAVSNEGAYRDAVLQVLEVVHDPPVVLVLRPNAKRLTAPTPSKRWGNKFKHIIHEHVRIACYRFKRGDRLGSLLHRADAYDVLTAALPSMDPKKIKTTSGQQDTPHMRNCRGLAVVKARAKDIKVKEVVQGGNEEEKYDEAEFKYFTFGDVGLGGVALDHAVEKLNAEERVGQGRATLRQGAASFFATRGVKVLDENGRAFDFEFDTQG